MSRDDAKIVASIIIHADGGCSSCVGDLGERLKKEYPEFKWGKLLNEARTKAWGERKDTWGWLDG